MTAQRISKIAKQEIRLKQLYDEVCSLRLPMKRDFDETDFNKFIAVGFLFNPPIDIMVGRVVQVREEWGAFGSNQIFIRCINEKLQVHGNQHFYTIPECLIEKYQDVLKSIEPDEPGIAYCLRGKQKRKGFIIPSKVKPGQTTPMRDVRADLSAMIEKLTS